MENFGIGEWFILLLVGSFIPAAVLYSVAMSRDVSRRYALWGLLLGWIGLIIGLLIMIATPRKEPVPPERQVPNGRF